MRRYNPTVTLNNVFVSVFFLLMIVSLGAAQAQDFQIQTSAPGSITVCDSEVTFDITITRLTTGTVQNVKLYPVMRPGMVYVQGSASGMTESTPGEGDALSFALSNFTGSTTVHFRARATCDLVAYLRSSGSASNLINNDTKLTYTLDGAAKTLLEPNGSESYSVLYPSLELIVPESDKSIAADFINVIKSRHVTIKNSGLGRLSSLDFFIKAEAQLAVQKLELAGTSGNVVIAPVTAGSFGIKYTLTDFSKVGNGNAYFEEGESVNLVDYVKVVGSSASIETIYTAQWGCQAKVCNPGDLQASFAVYVQAIAGSASLTLTDDLVSQTDFCNAAPAQINYTVQNQGAGNLPASRDAAFNVAWNMGFSGKGSIAAVTLGIRNKITGALTSLNQYIATTVAGDNRYYTIDFTNRFTQDPDGAGGLGDADQDGYYDDLPANTEFVIVATVKPTFSKDIVIPVSTFAGHALAYDKWSGERLSLGGGAQEAWSYIDTPGDKLTGASDLVGGVRKRFSLEAFTYTTPTPGLISSNNSTFDVEFDLPQNVQLVAAVWNANNTPLPITQNGTKAVIRYPFNKYPSYVKIDFDLELDCSQPLVNEKGDVGVRMYYYSDPACPLARFKTLELHREVYSHCGNCGTVSTLNLSVERKTLGWPYAFDRRYTWGDLYGSTAKPKVTPTTAGIKLNAAYPKDEVEAVVDGKVESGSYTELYVELRYKAPIKQELLQYNSGILYIGSTSYTIPLLAMQVIANAADTSYTYTVKMPLGSNGLPATVSAGTLLQFKAKYYVNEMAGVARGEYPLSELRAHFYGKSGGVTAGCLDFGDDFMIYKTSDVQSGAYGYHLTSENKTVIAYYSYTKANSSTAANIADFPSEFRPVFYINGHTTTLPQGYIFDRSKPVEYIINNSTQVFTYSGAVFSNGDRTITFTVSPDMPVTDFTGITFYGYVTVDCSHANNKFVPVVTPLDQRPHPVTTGTIKTFAYKPVSEHVLSTVAGNLAIYNTRRPNLKLTANSEQEGYSEVVNWPVQVCNPIESNNFFSDSPHTWVSIELKEDDNSTILLGATAEDGSVLDTAFYGVKDAAHPRGRNLLVKLGSVRLSACMIINVKATYKDCREDTVQKVNVLAGWDYVDFPSIAGATGAATSLVSATCEGAILTEEMSLKYKTAELQWEVRRNGADTTDLCVPVPFEIDLASTRYGDMKDLKVWLELPPHIVLDPAQAANYYYPYNSTAIPIPQEAVISAEGRTGWDVGKLLGGNLPGIRFTNNKMKLAFQLVTSCGFDPGVPVKFIVTGQTNCGDAVSFVDQRKIRLRGISGDDLALTLSGPGSLACFSDSDVMLSIQNKGNVSSSVNQLRVTLPFGMSYKSIVQSDLPAPVLNTSDGVTELHWTLPAGYLAANQTKSLTVRTFLSQTAAGSTNVTMSARTYQTGDAFCSGEATTCSTPVTSGSVDLQLPVTGLSSLDISYHKYLCAYRFTSQANQTGSCTLATYAWDFGDGGTAADRDPFHAFERPGTYKVSLRVTFNCGGCSGVQSKEIQMTVTPNEAILKDTTINVATEVKEEVIQVSASTFSDAWPTQHINSNLLETSSFLNATQGVWRNDAAYVYDVPRSASETVNIAKDGTFDLEMFNWEQADLNAVPNWIKANAMTQYSPFSYELENRDVLGVYSAALYDYGGHLPSANGVNMRNKEMAFTSFEFLDDKATGNWVFGDEAIPDYYLYDVQYGIGNMAVVEASMADLQNVEKVDVTARLFYGFFFFLHHNYVQNDAIVCMQPYPAHPEWTIIVLKDAPFQGLWKGRIKVNNEILPLVKPDIDATGLVVHSGKSSLLATGSAKIFKQQILQLDSGKNYLLNAWVSVNNPQVATSVVDASVGIDVVFRNDREQAVATYHLTPSGSIIEGWQQVRGIITAPGGSELIMELSFKPGSTGKAWYDDLRFHPVSGNMKSYVYDLKDYRLRAVLDEENFASYFYYDAEGNLYLTKKETENGIKTISENVNSMYEIKRNH